MWDIEVVLFAEDVLKVSEKFFGDPLFWNTFEIFWLNDAQQNMFTNQLLIAYCVNFNGVESYIIRRYVARCHVKSSGISALFF